MTTKELTTRLSTYTGDNVYLLTLKDVVGKGEELSFTQILLGKKFLMTHAIKTDDKTIVAEKIKEFKIDWNKYCIRPPYPFQRIGINWLLNKEKAILGDDMGCIDGNTTVTVNRGGCSKKRTLESLYQGFNFKWRKDIDTFISCYDFESKTFRLGKVLNVISSGVKEVWKLTLNDGKELKATSDHLILTTEGWKQMRNLTTKDIILTNGVDTCLQCNNTKNLILHKTSKFYGYCKTCMYRTCRKTGKGKGEYLRPDGYLYIRVGLRFHPNNRNGTMPKHRLIAEASLNSKTLTEWLDIIKHNRFTTESVFLSPELDVHHKDENRLNNTLENLEILTRHDHHIHHKKRTNIKKTIPKYLQVQNIENTFTTTPTYDITVDKHHNFVANKIIVHNCGKSLQAIVAALELNSDKVLIVCPASLKLNWAKEIIPFCNEVSVIGKDWHPKRFTIINYDILKKYLDKIVKHKFDLVIADEAHMVKNMASQRTKAFGKVANKSKRVWLLTGTPIANKPIDFYNLLKICKHDLGKNKQLFGQTYCGGQLTQWGYDYNGASNLKELHYKTQNVILRRKKEDVLDLPPKIRTPMYLEFSSKQRKDYENAVADYYNDKYNLSLDPTSPEYGKELSSEHLDLVTLSVLRRFNALQKVKDGSTIELIRIALEEGKKVAVFTNYIDVIDTLAAELGADCLTLDGRIDLTERQRRVDLFQSNKGPSVIVCNLAVASVGITLTKATVGIMNDLSWSPAVMQQAEDRLYRIGQKESVSILYPIYDESIDSIMFDVLKVKMKNISEAIEGKEIEAFDANIIKEVFTKIQQSTKS